MRVCLIKCPSPFLVDERVMPPLGLLAVGTVLKQQGHDVFVHDGAIDSIPQGYELYGVGPTTPEYKYALQIRDKIKAPIVIGGPHATMNPQQCNDDGFDFVFEGDYGDPIIDRSLIDIKSYKYYIDGELATTMVTARGCPYECAFCAKPDRTVKYRAVEDIIKEIDYLHTEFGYKALMFFDDIFILDKKRALRIAEYLRSLGIVWRCFVRADLVIRHGQGFLDYIRRCGCVEVGMGIESGSDIVLRSINKGETVEDMRTAISMLHKADIRVKGFFILGLPSESPETLLDTEIFIKDSQLDDADFTIFQPYKGSPIERHRERYDIGWNGEPSHYKGRNGEYFSSVYTSTLSSEDIVNGRERLSRKTERNNLYREMKKKEVMV